MNSRRAHSLFILSLALIAISVSACRFSSTSSDGGRAVSGRISDTPIIPGYIVTPGGMDVVRDPEDLTRLKFSAKPGSYGLLGGSPAALRIAVYAVNEAWITKIGKEHTGTFAVEGQAVGEIVSEPDGSVKETTLLLTENPEYLLLFVFDEAGGSVRFPTEITAPDPTAITAPMSDVGVGYFWNLFPMKPLGLWTTPEEIKGLDKKKVGYRYIASRANWQPYWDNHFDLGDTSMMTDAAMLAASIAYTAEPNKYSNLKKATIDAIGKLMALGQPSGTSGVTFSANIVAIVLAADLIGYRTAAFDTYLKNLVSVWTAPVGGKSLTIEGAWKAYANTAAGMQSYLALISIYAYIGDKANLEKTLNQWKTLLTGTPFTALSWLKTPWQADPKKKYFINPMGARVLCDGQPLDISGTMPQFMANTSPCSGQLAKGWEALKSLEMMVSAARIAERQGYPIWGASNHAIMRAVTALNFYKMPVKAYPALGWMLKFVDKRYGTCFRKNLEGLNASYEYAGDAIGYTWLEGEMPACP